MLKTTPFQIVIASDNRLIADGIAAHLRHAPDIDICARAADGQSVIDACLNYKPDALLLNPELPGKSSQEITRHLTESLPQTRIILVTGSDNHLETVRLFQAGAVACIHTDTMIDLVDTIRTVMQGQSIMPDFVLETLLSHSARPRPAPPLHPASPPNSPTAKPLSCANWSTATPTNRLRGIWISALRRSKLT